jgi:hypothetical protein
MVSVFSLESLFRKCATAGRMLLGVVCAAAVGGCWSTLSFIDADVVCDELVQAYGGECDPTEDPSGCSGVLCRSEDTIRYRGGGYLYTNDCAEVADSTNEYSVALVHVPLTTVAEGRAVMSDVCSELREGSVGDAVECSSNWATEDDSIPDEYRDARLMVDCVY